MPGETDFGRGLRLDIFADVAFKRGIGHEMLSGGMAVILPLFQIIAIAASQIAMRAGGLCHHIKRTGKGITSGVVHVQTIGSTTCG